MTVILFAVSFSVVDVLVASLWNLLKDNCWVRSGEYFGNIITELMFDFLDLLTHNYEILYIENVTNVKISKFWIIFC